MNKKERKAIFKQCKEALFPLDIWYDGDSYIVEEVTGVTLKKFRNIHQLAEYADLIEEE